MHEQLTLANKTMARWCYARGVDERLLGSGEQLRRAAVDHALGRPAPPHLEQALWKQTATLLRQRRDWDRDHQVSPPAPAACLPCAVVAEECPTHAGPSCRACGGQLHRIVVDEAFDTHACCDRPGANGSLAFLEHTAQLLGATLLAQPASSHPSAETRFAEGDRSHPWPSLRRPRRTGAAGAGQRIHGSSHE